MGRTTAQKVHLPQGSGGVVVQEYLEEVLVGAVDGGGAVDPVHDDDLAQLEMGDQRHRLCGENYFVTVPPRNAGHLGE